MEIIRRQNFGKIQKKAKLEYLEQYEISKVSLLFAVSLYIWSSSIVVKDSGSVWVLQNRHANFTFQQTHY